MYPYVELKPRYSLQTILKGGSFNENEIRILYIAIK